jgi:hypothetical protein
MATDFTTKEWSQVVHSEVQVLHQLRQSVEWNGSGRSLHFDTHREAVWKFPIPYRQQGLVNRQGATASTAIIVHSAAGQLLQVVVGESVTVAIHQNGSKAAAVALTSIWACGANGFRQLLKL